MDIERVTRVPQLPNRKCESHKGDFGRVLIVGGSRGMAGAAGLAGRAALRSGAGLVRIAVPEGIQAIVAAMVPCATTTGLVQDTRGIIAIKAGCEIMAQIAENDVVAWGPGLGISCGVRELLHGVLSQIKDTGWAGRGMVIDADGLNNLAKLGAVKLNNNVVLTPHPGEMKRLWRAYCSQDISAMGRLEQTVMLARHCGAVVVLKGADTVVSDGERAYVNTTGNAGMATGGSGDVLTGVIAALIANKQVGLSVFEAAVLGVYVHGKAGDMLRCKLGQTALTADDIIATLGQAWSDRIDH